MGEGDLVLRIFIAVQRVICKTSATEIMHMLLHKTVKNRSDFLTHEIAQRLLYLALRETEKDWIVPPIA
ncbi:hypothetical protein [Noviherbaspirillum denitrificans]|uniref:Uncharacterized protein n=1 Tax=Noviherbaspirillum denitrificans TaxID=1968433 RepID=A0A254TFJ0_9BURK|nr:hypothetical protein [Noviherbaspirillum denitrificans]OWW21380.1 hypothetical protein AYR66_19730 [Noviherbaspirillum denitrificans]